MLQHLGEIQADITAYIASQVGHELHQALIDQAIVRLQTCVPLRSWQAAYGELEERDREAGGDTDAPSEPPTLH